MKTLFKRPDRYPETPSIWEASTNGAFAADSERTQDAFFPTPNPRIDQEPRSRNAYDHSQNRSRRLKRKSAFGRTTRDPAFRNLIQSSAPSAIKDLEQQAEEDPESSDSDSTLELVQQSELPVGTTSVSSSGPPSDLFASLQQLETPNFFLLQEGSTITLIPLNLALDQFTNPDTAHSKAKKFADRRYLMAQLNQALRKHFVMTDYADSTAAPMDARAMGLGSRFRPCSSAEKVNIYKEGQLPTDFKQWADGFNAKLFAQSQRLVTYEDAPFVPYRFSGKLKSAKEFYGEDEYFRRRDAFKKLLDVTPLNRPPAPAGFTRLASAFFNGEPINEDFDIDVGEEQIARNTIKGTITACLDNFEKETREEGLKKLEIAEQATKALPSTATRQPKHVVTYSNSAWAKLTDEMLAEMQLETDERHKYPFKNNTHKALGMFLQDLIIANELEEHCIKKTRYTGTLEITALREPDGTKTQNPGLRVYRVDEYENAMKLCSDGKAGNLKSVSKITAIDEIGNVRGSAVFITRAEGESSDEFGQICGVLAGILSEGRKNSTTAGESSRAQGVSIIAVRDNLQSSDIPTRFDVPQAAERRSSQLIQDPNSPEKPVNISDDEKTPEKTKKAKKKSKSTKSRPKQKKRTQVADQEMPEEVVEEEDSKQPGVQPGAAISKPPQPLQAENVEKERQISMSDYEDEGEGNGKKVDDGWKTVKAKASQKPRAAARGGLQGPFRGPIGGQNRDSYSQQSSVRQQNHPQQPANGPNTNQILKQNNIVPKNNPKNVHVKPAIPALVAKATSSPLKAITNIYNSAQPSRDVPSKLPVFDEEEFPVMPSKPSEPTKSTSSSKSPSTLADVQRVTSQTVTAVSPEIILLQPIEKVVSKEVIAEATQSSDSLKVKEHEEPVQPQASANDPDHNSTPIQAIDQEEIADHQRTTQQEETPQSDDHSVLDTKDKVKEATVAPTISVTDSSHHLATACSVAVNGNADIDVNSHSNTATLALEVQVNDSLSWAGDALSSPSKFESGSRRTSLPGGSCRPSEDSIGASRLLLRVRPRSKSMNTGIDQEPEEEQALEDGPSDDTESNDSSVIINCGPGHGHLISPAGIATSKNEEFSSICTDNSLSQRPRIQNHDSTVEWAGGSVYDNLPILNTSMAMPIPTKSLSVDHGHPNRSYFVNQAGYRVYASGEIESNSAVDETQSRSQAGSAAPSFGTFSVSGISSRGTETPMLAEEDDRQNAVVYYCSFCNDSILPTPQTPLVFCPCCGPKCNIRYCAVACLLVDAYDHAIHCMNYPASERAAPHNLPAQFIYEMNPLMSTAFEADSKEKFRQKAFSMYCKFGPFPNLLGAWLKRNPGGEVVQAAEAIESRKVTGDYHVFSSRATSRGPRFNDKADVIFTVFIAHGHPMKNVLNRCLNACFVIHHPRIVEFLFRMLRSFLMDPNIFSQFPHSRSISTVFTEFNHQFKKEFGFDAQQQANQNDFFDFTPELAQIIPALTSLEAQYPVLQYWNRC